MVLNFLGCGSAFNPVPGNTSAYFIREESLFLIDAVTVKHAEGMKCFGYIIEIQNERIFYSGDSYELPQKVFGSWRY